MSDDRRNLSARKSRLSVRTALWLLARELWARDHDVYDRSEWDNSRLPTRVYERYFEKAEAGIREGMERGWRA